ncbi:MAG: sugar ABC transporter ATP-binding protein [Janthinobacterium lividum]
MTQGAIELVGVAKAYGPTLALAPFTHRFEPGRVHALMGKNGSGKSTLIKILAGAVRPTLGRMTISGKPAVFDSPVDAFKAGIVTVHQELSLVPVLSVGENIYLGRLPQRRMLGRSVVDWPRVHADATRLLQGMGLDIDSRAPVGSLSVGQQQVVEIVKAMSFRPAILLLDEPTSALASREVALLFELVRRLRSSGVTMIYITHRMNELFEIADTCTVLRDGHAIGTTEMTATSPEGIVEMMFGDVARAVRPARPAATRGTPVLAVRGLTRAGAFTDVSFDLHRGEVLGFAGLLGAGRTEVLRAVFGADPFDEGTIAVDGTEVRHPTLRRMKALGVGYTPENRKEAGLVQARSVHDNLCLASLGRIARHGLIDRGREKPFVDRQIEGLAIKVPDALLPVSSLSGGNQQKIVIGNWLNTHPKVMFFDEPSRGVDVQAKQQIFDIMWREAAGGLSSVFVSSEPEELLEVADRILVMRLGRIVAEVLPSAVTLAELYRLCMEGRPS